MNKYYLGCIRFDHIYLVNFNVIDSKLWATVIETNSGMIFLEFQIKYGTIDDFMSLFESIKNKFIKSCLSHGILI